MPRVARRKGRGKRLNAFKKWVKSAHSKIRSVHGYSRLGRYIHGKAQPILNRRLTPTQARLVNAGVNHALTKLHQKGYGCGGAVRRAGRRRLGYGVHR